MELLSDIPSLWSFCSELLLHSSLSHQCSVLLLLASLFCRDDSAVAIIVTSFFLGGRKEGGKGGRELVGWDARLGMRRR